MAQRRMISNAIIGTDRFLDMPPSSQCLYFHFCANGDDDGFVGSPRKIMVSCGCKVDDLNILIAKGFVYRFNSGVCVITDWKIHNTLKNDRYHETLYLAEKAEGIALNLPCFQNGSKMVPEHNITKHNITKHNLTESIEKEKCKRKDFSSELSEVVEDWLKYKNELGQPYTETGLKSVLTRISKHAKLYGDTAIADVIRDSMANNYQGIDFGYFKRYR